MPRRRQSKLVENRIIMRFFSGRDYGHWPAMLEAERDIEFHREVRR